MSPRSSKARAACPRCGSPRPRPRARCTCTARTSPRGSRRARRKCSSSARIRCGRTAAIRGGVPICFPWFGDKADDPHAPAHGFVRTKTWQLESIEQNGDAVSVSMFTDSDESTQKWWPSIFGCVHRATFGPELVLELTDDQHRHGSVALRRGTARLLQSGRCHQGQHLWLGSGCSIWTKPIPIAKRRRAATW